MNKNIKIKRLKGSLYKNKSFTMELFNDTTPKNYLLKLIDIYNSDSLYALLKLGFKNINIIENIKTKKDAIIIVENCNMINFLEVISDYFIENIEIFETKNNFNLNLYLYNNNFLEDENIILYGLSNYVIDISNKENESYILTFNKNS